ncbi:MAG: acyl-CoA dehydrogenase family protein, partial [Acidimicrobiales bacterium]
MHFAFDEQQLEFRAQLRAFADKHCTPRDLRAAWASELGWSPARWAALAELGVVGLTVPEAYGGLGLGPVDLVLLLEEAGRSGLPEPLLETTAVGVPLLAEAPGPGAEALRAQWLPSVAGGRAVVAVGTSAMSAVAPAGAHLLLLQRLDEVHAVAAGGVSSTPLRSIDGARRLAEITWEPSPATLLVSGTAARALLGVTGD